MRVTLLLMISKYLLQQTSSLSIGKRFTRWSEVINLSGDLSEDLVPSTSSASFNSFVWLYRDWRRFDKSRRATFALYRPRRLIRISETMDEGDEDSLESRGAFEWASIYPKSKATFKTPLFSFHPRKLNRRLWLWSRNGKVENEME